MYYPKLNISIKYMKEEKMDYLYKLKKRMSGRSYFLRTGLIAGNYQMLLFCR